MDVSAIAARRAALEAELARRSLRVFLRVVWPIIEPTQPYHDNWHIALMCEDLEALTYGETEREIINIPPGTMKSLLVNVIWPAWMWATDASLRFLKASYSDHLTIRDNLKLRAIVTSEWYRTHYGVVIEDDQNQKKQFKTSVGGWSFATSVGGAGLGEHPDYFIIDDPITATNARSAVFRQEVTLWFDRTVSARGIIRSARFVLVMQRLDADDLSGHLLARGGWKHLCLPMRYEVARDGYVPEPRDPRRETGALLWPDVFTESKVKQLELDLGPYGTAGQLQQHPSPEGGGLFKREWFTIVEAAPRVARRVRAWDTAATVGGGDWTVGVRLAEHDGTFYVEDVQREQLGPAGVDGLLMLCARRDGVNCAVREAREPGSAGVAVIAARLKLLVGYDYVGVQESGDKVTRSKPYRAQVEGLNVKLVRGAWNESYLSELCDFPTGKHDDQVDASTTAFNAVLLEPVPQPDWCVV